ncbi:uncharacterized protein UHO2_07315 [Ustilago hordei]|uniref:Uncharacterized protein n=1 Tax=Ustilago hordei TaxID=120017 RepID=I2FRX2_USTHO|nr:uncharacterized protein UHO2_07315 [Ustilago hordei]CCF49665.1 uncharacterized protein UHOR_03178 [Ustilago hordei]SYW87178.1 uncharacterized protein UHO2_07315 [Ustilago hordei]
MATKESRSKRRGDDDEAIVCDSPVWLAKACKIRLNLGSRQGEKKKKKKGEKGEKKKKKKKAATTRRDNGERGGEWANSDKGSVGETFLTKANIAMPCQPSKRSGSQPVSQSHSKSHTAHTHAHSPCANK